MTAIFQKILGRQKPHPEQNEATLPLSQVLPVAAPTRDHSTSSLEWVFASAQSVGRQREHNEDALFTFGSHMGFEESQTFVGFFAVADGMGGHANGELASGLAVRTIAEQVVKKSLDYFFSNDSAPQAAELKELLLIATQEANQEVKNKVPGGGTTLTALLIIQDQLLLTHVGDSRAYLITSEGVPHLLTHDHSFVRQLVDLGQISAEEAAVHPQRNILSMALGQWEPLEPDFVTQPIPDKGHILICSDGLWGVLPDRNIVEIIQTTNDLSDACHKLIGAANQAGGPDNITAILIRIPN